MYYDPYNNYYFFCRGYMIIIVLLIVNYNHDNGTITRTCYSCDDFHEYRISDVNGTLTQFLIRQKITTHTTRERV